MTASYQDLLKQRADLDRAIESARQDAIKSAVTRARELVAEYQLTVADVFPAGGGRAKKSGSGGTGAKVAPKYRDPVTGKTWTGRGKAPVWINGKDRSKFAI